MFLNNHSSINHQVINKSIFLQPEEYFLITKDTTAFIKYPKILKLIVSGFPTLSNTRDKLMLLDSLNRTIDSLEYKSLWGGTGGKSLERIDAKLFSTDSTNWKSSRNINGATPGFVNSVSKKKYDMAVTALYFTPANPLLGQKVNIYADIQNVGRSTADFKVIISEIKQDGSKVQLNAIPTTGLMGMNPGGKITAINDNSIAQLFSKRTFG